MIEVSGLGKRFGARAALADVSARVADGEFVAVLGPNGAGKSTLLRILATLDVPTHGTVRLAGRDPADDGVAVRRLLGYVGHEPALYEDLTARENLRFFGGFHPVPDLDARVTRALADAGLADRADDRVRAFSRGMRQRLALARATLHEPRLLLLDEPFTGLDAPARRALREQLAALRGRATVLYSTHDADTVTDADRALVLRQGRLVHDGAPEEAARRLQEARDA